MKNYRHFWKTMFIKNQKENIKKMSIIICGFSGIGKSTAEQKNKRINGS